MLIQGSKGGQGTQATPTESPDTLHDVARIRIVDLLAEGELAGFVHGSTNPLRDVYLNETPICNADDSFNFSDIVIDARTGTQDQDPMSGFGGTENEIAVGVELRSSAPWTQAITDLDLSALRLRLSVDSLQSSDASTGDINGYTIAYKIELATDGGAFVQVASSSIGGKTTSEYDKTHLIQLPKATIGWTLRVTRTTPNKDSATVADTMRVQSYTEIIDAVLRYPNSAVVGLIVDAKQFQSVPNRAYNMLGRIMSVPSNYNPNTRVYTGTWDGTFKPAWTNNPAWVFYDLVLNARFGLGRYITPARVNKWALYEIAQYCDELVPNGKGGTEPRFTCTLYLQTQADAYKVLADLTSIFRGLTYWSGSAIQAVADKPGDPDFEYTAANVIDGKFEYAGSPRKSRYTVALVSWNDPADFGRAKVAYVPDREGIARYGVQTTQMIAVGATSESQAQRQGLWALMTSRLATETVTWGVGQDGVLVGPGRICRIADPKRAGKRQGGRLAAASTRTNLLPYSTDLSHWAVSGGTASQGVMSPDSVNYMRRVTANAGTTNAQLAETVTVTLGATYTLSVTVRRDQNRYAKLFGFGNGSGGAVIDLQTGATQINSTWLSVGVQMIDANTARIYGVVQPISSGQALVGLAANMAGTAALAGTAFLDFWGAQLEPGDTLHDLVATGATGLTVTDVTVDKAPELAVNGDTLNVMLPSGVSESKPIIAVAGNTVTVSGTFSETPVAEAAWTVDHSLLATQTVRVLSVKEQLDEGKVSYVMTGVQHNASIFDAVDNGAALTVPPTVYFPETNQAAPVSVVVASFVMQTDSQVNTVLEIGWDRPDGAVAFEVVYRRSSGSWSTPRRVSTNHLDMYGVLPGVYDVQVVAINAIGIRSPATQSDPYTVNDPNKIPGAVDDIANQAHQAQLDATSALNQIGAIGSDGVLAQGEKKTVIRDYNVLTTEQPGIDTQADAFGIVTEKTAYDSAISDLTTYLGSLNDPTAWDDLTGDTNVVRATFWSEWQTAYIKRQALLNAIYAAAKTRADNAQNDATNALNNAPVVNPKFTPSTFGWTFDTAGSGEWTTSTGANSPESGTNTFLVHSGVAGQITTTAHNTSGGIPVKAGQTVTAAVSLRAVGANSGARAYVRIGWYTATRALISNSTYGVTSCAVDAGTNLFTQGVSRVYGNAPTNAAIAIVEIEFDNHTSGTFTATGAVILPGHASLDEIQDSQSYAKTPVMGGSALVIGNANFMAPAAADGTIPGWSRFNSATLSYFTGSLPNGGTGQSLKVTATGSTPSGFGAVTPNYKVSAGDTISASAWGVSSTGGLPYIQIYFFDSNNNYLAFFQGAGTTYSVWQQMTVSGKAPAGSAYAFIRLGNPGTGGGVSYFADVHATRTTQLATEVSGTLATQRNLPLVTWGNYGGGWSGLTLNYSTTTTSCTFSASAANYVGGGDSIAYNSGSVTVSGTAGSVVTYYLYYDDPSMTGGSKSLQATTNQITSLNANGRVLLATVKVTYPTSGTGSGGGGTACPQVDEPVIRRAPCGCPETIRAGDVREGDFLLLASGRWGRVSYSDRVLQPCVRVTGEDGSTITCSESAPLETAEGPCAPAAFVEGLVLKHRAAGVMRAARVIEAGHQWVQHITCEDDCFWVGDYSHHNLKPIG